MRRAAAVALAALAAATPALAHGRAAPTPETVASAWSADPGVLCLLSLSAGLYLRGLGALWTAAGHGRGIRRGEAACFAAGWTLLAVALVSPLHRAGEALLSAHMVQHELLMVAAAPLLVLGRPLVAAAWALPRGWRGVAGRAAAWRPASAAWRAATHPLAAWTLHAAAVWGWHLPGPYQAALASDGWHAAQHASFLGTALLFWWSVTHGRAVRAGHGAALVSVFTTALHTGGLGALLTFAGTPWYPAYASTAPAWGWTALEDQQMAGLVMWIPGGLSYLAAALFLFAAWMRAGRRRVERRERARDAAPAWRPA
jgi:putative membrane protein